jgi:hypothetical protein
MGKHTGQYRKTLGPWKPTPYTQEKPCPICGGYVTGEGKNWCGGYITQDGKMARCSSEAHAGALESDPDPLSFSRPDSKGPVWTALVDDPQLQTTEFVYRFTPAGEVWMGHRTKGESELHDMIAVSPVWMDQLAQRWIKHRLEEQPRKLGKLD